MPARLRFAPQLLVAAGVVFLLSSSGCKKRNANRPPETASTAPVVFTTSPAASSSSAAPPAPAEDKSGASQMTEAERKAAARSAFAEGVVFQDHRDCAQALPRFEVAQRLYDAPTHLLHMAQCQALMGRLIEAQESYSTLAHVTLTPQAPAIFREAKEAGRVELTKLTPRIPTMRIDTSPPASSLKSVVVKVNGSQVPVDLVGVARPVNPGKYHVTVTASPNKSGAGDLELKEGETKSLEVKLSP